MRLIRDHLTYSNVMATLAVFLVLGGGAYAAFHLPKNSVRSRNIVNGQVKKADLAGSLKSPPAIHTVASGAFENGWHNYGFGDTPAGFFRDREGVVHLRGIVAPQT